MKAEQVVIVGAGPTGLVLALWLSKLGVGVRIIDKTERAGTTSRAVAVAAHTLELYRQLDLADAVVHRGHHVSAANLWVRGKAQARVPLGAIGNNLSPFLFLHMFPQDQHEQLLIERLGLFGVRVERRTELLDFEDDGERIVARVRGPDGEERIEAAYLAGCDGAHSTVRKAIGAGFDGGTYRELFYVADIEASGPAMNGELHIDLDEADFLAVFPLTENGRARLIGTVRDERAQEDHQLRFEDVDTRAIEQLKIQIGTVNWFSTYRVHHRVADRFRRGRAFLLGDAGHVHSPVGGQGMNTGIGDAINLAWKLAAVREGAAPDALLDSYPIERMTFARKLVSTTDRAFTFINAEGRIAELVRTRLAPVVVPALLRRDAVREFIFRTVSQIALNYRGGPLSEGRAGDVRGGERLPWVKVGACDNAASLAQMRWQVHVYGEVPAEVAAWCDRHAVALHRFAWDQAYATAGLARDALYLIRPDTYVALAEPRPTAAALQKYFQARGLRLMDRDGPDGAIP